MKEQGTHQVHPSSPAVNDIILFRKGELPVIRRIVNIEQGPQGLVVITKGDNVDIPDASITSDQIEGRAVFLIPEVGHLNLWLRGRSNPRQGLDGGPDVWVELNRRVGRGCRGPERGRHLFRP